MRVLTWNLFHGRAVPPAGRELFEEFATALAGWEWDVALLQEVPPWWGDRLGVRCGADWRSVLTSRNFGLGARRFVAVRWPDLIKSNGGGSNVILVRAELRIEDDRVARLGWWPERRWVQAVRLSNGWWVGNLHTEALAAQGRAAAQALRSWAVDEPAVLGGDFNVRDLALPGFVRAGGLGVDQVFVKDLAGEGVHILDRGPLSDHAPVLVSVVRFPA